jgi:hypothetical protein
MVRSVTENGPPDSGDQRHIRVTPGDTPGHCLSWRNFPQAKTVSQTTNCPRHGWQGIGLLCTHVAHAIDSGENVGFFWGDDTDNARPDAWCATCERKLVALQQGVASDRWFMEADFKILCAFCWDDARRALYERMHDA